MAFTVPIQIIMCLAGFKNTFKNIFDKILVHQPINIVKNLYINLKRNNRFDKGGMECIKSNAKI